MKAKITPIKLSRMFVVRGAGGSGVVVSDACGRAGAAAVGAEEVGTAGVGAEEIGKAHV